MLHSILLFFDGAQPAEAGIDIAVQLATRHQARLRGLSVTDTRAIEALADCETAAYFAGGEERLHRGEQQQSVVHADLSLACLTADLNFDVRRLRGNPLQLLPREARFHDLSITCYAASQVPGCVSQGLRPRELVELAMLGLQPLYVVRRLPQAPQRVLLVHDGTPASGRAIRLFLMQGIAPSAEYRFLTLGEDEAQARESCRELTDYLRRHHVAFETGRMPGSVRKNLVPYARKWQADVVVLGAARGRHVADWLFGEAAEWVLTQTECALYVTT